LFAIVRNPQQSQCFASCTYPFSGVLPNQSSNRGFDREFMLGTLGFKIILIEDDAATVRTLALGKPVDSANQRFGNTRWPVGEITAATLAAAAGIARASSGHPEQTQGGKYG